MELFHVIDEGVAILRIRGATFKQTKVFRRGDKVYAEASGGFIELLRGAGTSNPRISWLGVEGPNIDVSSGIPKWIDPKPVQASTPKPARKRASLKVVG